MTQATTGGPGAAQGGSVPAVSVRSLTKHFQAITALSDVSIDFLPGEVHVLFGENGAGKSTLIKVLAGVHRADAGSVVIGGAETSAASPRHARELGISAVFQDPALVPQLTVAENLTLGREPMRAGLVSRRERLRIAEEALHRVGSSISPHAVAGDLGRAEQQIVEIARALQGSAKVLILDEPTASLTDEETDRLFAIVRRLRQQGLAVIYITHRMKEIRAIGDVVTILRDGGLIRTCRLDEVDDEGMVTLMTGRKVDALFPSIAHRPGAVALELEGLSGEDVRDVSLTVRGGEIVGLAGLVGSGKGTIGRLCFGLARRTSGRLLVRGKDLGTKAAPARYIGAGVMYYPADRKRDGLVGVRPAAENVSLTALDRWSGRGFLKRGEERRDTAGVLERLTLRPMRPEALPSTFSGGNQQKIVLARGFTRPYAVHIFDEPTAGVDVGARADIYAAIQELVESGAAVVLISSDLPEVLNLAHRLYVITEGRVAAEFSGADLTEETVLPTFFPHESGVTS
ncbi:sugar ABC transporter ATP-binding protein [Peterkaempfera bronchialis]|uniref:Sugar ABC transporter ATP-binding protein n=1 Tax=Peterkaempfera bronchialis TaxID=2126346 RepID=A0A345T3G1_9ACTN|nr:sugar ABC transporter ATP-binding protein [Peterkaempfera bronchialis]AXI80516.1 sugar ABC transporter ATP-binding protein [Peterkaempfera bronchialis]